MNLAAGPERYGLSWPGKAECLRAIHDPPRATLRPRADASVDWDATGNVIIEGDNLDALKLLRETCGGRVKIIYIDPPYNTGNDFLYRDRYGRSSWLSMMYPRLCLARSLLHPSGLIVVQIGDAELATLRLMMDELFGEEHYVNTIAIKAKVAAGASGGGEDRRLKKNVEFALVYARDIDCIDGFARSYVEEPLLDAIRAMRENGQSWKYTNVLLHEGEKRRIATTHDGAGHPIEIYLHEGIERASVRELCERDGVDEDTIYRRYLPRIFSDTNAQTSIRHRVIEATGPLRDGQMYSVEYVPASGRDRGRPVTHYYISPTVRRLIWLSYIAFARGETLIKRERTGTLWDDISYNNIGKEGGVPFANGKKPVALLRRVLTLSASKDDLVLDFFAGSGTTAHAVLEQNEADGGTRRFILVQEPEPLEGEQRTISQLTVQRVRNVIEQIEADRAREAPARPRARIGFRFYTLA